PRALAGGAASACRPARRGRLRGGHGPPGGRGMKADPRIDWLEHAGVDAWGEAIAADLQAALAADLATRGRARALLSGGTTPAPAYNRLAQAPLDWSKVSVGLVDDR